MFARVRQDEIVHHLDGGGSVPQHQRRGAERVEQVIELDRQQRLLCRQRHQRDPGLDDEAERAFGADDDAGQIDGTRRIDECIEVVAADAAQHLRKAPVDFRRMADGELGNAAVGARFDAVALLRARQLPGIERAEMRQRSVRQHHALLEHVIDGLAVQHRAGAARVVGHHPAHRGAARRRHVRSEAQLMLAQHRVQVVEHHAGFDPRPSLVRVDLDHPVQILRGVEHEAGADRLAGLRGAAAPRRERDAMSGGDRNGANHRLGGLGNDDAQRLDLVDAGVGGVKRARNLVEADLAVDGGFELALQRHWLLPRAAIGHTASTRSPRIA